MAMMPVPVKQMHERACEQQQIGEDPQQVSPMFCQQEEKRDRKETDKNPSGAAGHSAAVLNVF
ncbi:hypothetical protein GCM10025794_03500 [Massilia kyonggiensis]